MEILKDEALILRRKYVNEANYSISMLTKKYGKISAIAFGVSKSKSKEKISLNPSCIVDVEINKKIDSNILTNYSLISYPTKIYTNFEKISLCMYVLDSLNKMLFVGEELKGIYEIAVLIIKFIEDTDFSDEEYRYKFLYRYLVRMCEELGIYERGLGSNLKEYKDKFELLESFVNDYLGINIQYSKIWEGNNESS